VATRRLIPHQRAIRRQVRQKRCIRQAKGALEEWVAGQGGWAFGEALSRISGPTASQVVAKRRALDERADASAACGSYSGGT